MNQADAAGLKELIEEAQEDNKLEFKKASGDLPKEFWPTYSAFANTAGGVILLGVEENDPKNIVAGVKNPAKIIADLFNILSNKNKVSDCVIGNDQIKTYVIDGKTVIWIEVPEASDRIKPIYLNGRMETAYIRKGSGDYLIDSEQLRSFLRNASPGEDSKIVTDASLDDLDPFSLASYKEKVSIRYPAKKYNELSTADFLLEIGAISKNRKTQEYKIKNGTLLFLGKYTAIRDYFPSYHLDYLNRKNLNNRWVDRVATDEPNQHEMNIYQFYSIVSEKLRALVYERFKLDSKQVRMPMGGFDESLREALVNCLAHADYSQMHPSIKIETFDGFFTFQNPGKMLVSYETYVKGGESRPRNEQIMSLFRYLGVSERQGWGGAQIFKFAHENRYRQPEIHSNLEHTKVKIWHVDLVDSYPDMLPDEKAVYQVIVKSDVPVSSKDLILATGFTEYRIRKAIDALKAGKHISVLGKARSTRYSALVDFASVITKIQSDLDAMKDRLQGNS
ncbi:MAG TPA: AAA family ATPase [Clostridiales bacterium]|nr:AAA family ATPase [Clostridiales bacterium]